MENKKQCKTCENFGYEFQAENGKVVTIHGALPKHHAARPLKKTFCRFYTFDKEGSHTAEPGRIDHYLAVYHSGWRQCDNWKRG